jgi:hypothetical protein
MRWLSLFLACQHLNSGTNLRECEDQSCFKFQAVPVFRFDKCTLFWRTPGVHVSQVEDRCSNLQPTTWTDCIPSCNHLYYHFLHNTKPCYFLLLVVYHVLSTYQGPLALRLIKNRYWNVGYSGYSIFIPLHVSIYKRSSSGELSI